MQRRKFQQKARSLWQVEYPQEPFNLDLDANLFFTDDDLPSRLSVDVLAAAARQKVFFYQVTGLCPLFGVQIVFNGLGIRASTAHDDSPQKRLDDALC